MYIYIYYICVHIHYVYVYIHMWIYEYTSTLIIYIICICIYTEREIERLRERNSMAKIIFIRVTCSQNFSNVFFWNVLFLSKFFKFLILFRSQRFTFSYSLLKTMSKTCSRNMEKLCCFFSIPASYTIESPNCFKSIYPGCISTDSGNFPQIPFSVFHDVCKNKSTSLGNSHISILCIFKNITLKNHGCLSMEPSHFSWVYTREFKISLLHTWSNDTQNVLNFKQIIFGLFFLVRKHEHKHFQ